MNPQTLMRKTIATLSSSAVAVASLAPAPLLARESDTPLVTAQPPTRDPAVARVFLNPAKAPHLSRDQLVTLLRKKVKYVFVIFNENESFDHEYGTFPGANGLYANAEGPARSGTYAGLRAILYRQLDRAAGYGPPLPPRSGAERDRHGQRRP